MLRYTAGRGDRIKQSHFRAFSVVRSQAVKRGEFCGAGVVTKLRDKSPQRLLDFLVTRLIVFLLCHFGIGYLQHGFMRNCSMMSRVISCAITLATMIRHTTTMIMRRIIDDSLLFVLK